MGTSLSLLLRHYQRLYPLYTNLPVSLQRGARRFYHWLQARHVPSASAQGAAVFTGETYVTPQVNAALPSGVNLHGFLMAATGLGQHARLIAGCVEQSGLPFVTQDYDLAVGIDTQVNREGEVKENVAPYNVNLFCYNAPQIINRYQLDQGAVFRGRYNIGYGYWEMTRYPTAWLNSMNLLDEIWAPSRFVQEVISARASKPVVHMPVPVEIAVPPQIARSHFGLAEGKFLFLFTFDFLSGLQRKNPMAVIAAFKEAFPNRDDVGLVIKVSTHAYLEKDKREAFAKFMTEVGNDARITVIDKMLAYEQVLQLMQCCDVYVSLHRTEGFGLGMAESMLLGKPVIATGYSGNMDFMTAQNSCLVDYRLIPLLKDEYYDWQGQYWADADVEHAAQHMLRLAEHREIGKVLGEVAQRHMREHFSFAAAGARYKTRLELLGLAAGN